MRRDTIISGLSGALEAEIIELLSVADSVLNSIGLIKTEQIQLVDTYAVTIGALVTELIALVDGITAVSQKGVVVNEYATLTDTFYTNAVITILENLSVLDTILKSSSVTIEEKISLLDAVTAEMASAVYKRNLILGSHGTSKQIERHKTDDNLEVEL